MPKFPAIAHVALRSVTLTAAASGISDFSVQIRSLTRTPVRFIRLFGRGVGGLWPLTGSPTCTVLSRSMSAVRGSIIGLRMFQPIRT